MRAHGRLFCVEPMCSLIMHNMLMVGMRREGTKQGGWERAGCDWVERPCPNTATPRVPLPEDSLDVPVKADVTCWRVGQFALTFLLAFFAPAFYPMRSV